ncbi:MAG: arginine--tRNA ligase [Nevskia sp.]|nr:arginine--tRNA ligase [Nevskia sp.]
MKSQLQTLLREALDTVLAGAVPAPETINLEPARDRKHGDFATNVALTLAKPLGRPPRQVAEAIVQALPPSPLVKRVDIAGPGFINFFLVEGAMQALVTEILQAGPAYGRAAPGSAGRVMVEFVSANPTGPMHVGHGRNAAYGDALANVLEASGWEVFREYYINDAGRQADILTVSVWLRYLQDGGAALAFPESGYPGDYIREAAAALRLQMGAGMQRAAADVAHGLPADEAAGGDKEKHMDALIARARALLGAGYEAVQRLALERQLADIRATLDAFGVRFDRWASERDTVDSGAVRRAVEQLRIGGHTYEQDGALWLRTTFLGDEKDRVLIKADGSATYFVNDIAYHVDKLARHWPNLLDVWGADHHGYIARMRAAIRALTGRKDALQVQLIQFVTLSSGRMGKRRGNFVTLKDLIGEAGRDATRFFYLSRSHDQHLEFDVELARSQSNDNPVYYVQYAHARIASVFRQAAERGLPVDLAAPAPLERLVDPTEQALLAVLARYVQTLRNAAANSTPHLLTFYLRELADGLHRWYNACPFLVDDAALRKARLALAAATQQVLRNGLALAGVSAPDKM